MNAQVAAGVEIPSGPVVYPASARGGGWVTAIVDASASAQTATELLRPLSVTSSNINVVRLSDAATRVQLRLSYPTTVTAVATQPVVRVFGVDGPDAALNSSFNFDETNASLTALRLDNVDTAGTGLTLTIGLVANDLRVNDTLFSDPNSLTPIDTLGFKWLLVLLNTAASKTGAGAVAVQVRAIN